MDRFTNLLQRTGAGVAAAARRFAAVIVRRAAPVAGLEVPAAVVPAFVLFAAILDHARTATLPTTRLGVADAAASRVAAAAVGQTAMGVNSLAAAAVVAVGASACPGRRAGHSDARDRHHDCSQGLKTSTQHNFLLLNSHYASVP